MRHIGLISLSALVLLGACAKHDPILPGTRECVFSSNSLDILNTKVPKLSDTPSEFAKQNCPYTQDSSNVIWDGDKKIFSGFPTSNFVQSGQKPVCKDGFVYVGLTTGELVKLNPKTRDIDWLADIYRPSNMTGGAAVLDIVAPIIINKSSVYAGGLGDAFCRIKTSSGTKVWCLDIGVGVPFIIQDNVAFVVGTDNYLYAINAVDGKIYWRQSVKKQIAPSYTNKIITVGKESFDGQSGQPIK